MQHTHRTIYIDTLTLRRQRRVKALCNVAIGIVIAMLVAAIVYGATTAAWELMQ